MALSLLVLLASALQTGTPRQIGPASAELRLSETLERVLVESPPLDEMARHLASAEEESAGDLRLSYSLARSVLRGEETLPALPRDPGLLLVLAREWPVPTPASWVPAFVAQLGAGPLWDVALLEWIAKAEGSAGPQALQSLIPEERALHWLPPTRAAAMELVGLRGNLEGARQLFAAQSSLHNDVRHYAILGFRKLIAQQIRKRRDAALADFYNNLHLAYPPGTTFLLEAAAKWIRLGKNLDQADRWLEEVEISVQGRLDTGSLEVWVNTRLGRFWSAFFAGEPIARIEALLGDELVWPRQPAEREDTLRIAQAKVDLVRGFLREWAGESGKAAFQRALEEIPKDANSNPFDRAFYGTFGPYFAIQIQRRLGHADPARESLANLVAEIEASTAWTGLGLLNRDEFQEDRAVSDVFLRLAELTLQDAGDPDAAAALLAERLPILEKLGAWPNPQTLLHGKLLAGRIHLHRRDGANAMQAIETAEKLCSELRLGWREHFVKMRDRGELPPVPPERTLWQEERAFSDWNTRALLQRAGLEATLLLDRTASTRSLHRASIHARWDEDRWAAVALNHAARGLSTLAERALTCVEPSAPYYYDLGCAHAYLGNEEQAIEFLEQHLATQTCTPAGRRLEVEFMRKDPDLQRLSAHPRFPQP